MCLREMRLATKMTQSELASLLGYSQAYVSKYERGQMQLSFVEVRRVCIELGGEFRQFVAEYEERLAKRRVDNEG